MTLLIKEKAISKYCINIIEKLNTKKTYYNFNVLKKDRAYKGFSINPFDQEWFNEFCIALNEYKEQHPFLTTEIGPWNTHEDCNYQKYEPGTCYKSEHCEHNYSFPLRILAWMFYCNNIKKGGETNFPQQKIKVKPKEGTLVIWPAFWTHSHMGIKAPNETKYIVTGWCKLIEPKLWT